ncbi:MAG: antitoxin MazE family protein [Tagaea sp.]|nr:antitoxin MazE family protein [Tagaea sp.]
MATTAKRKTARPQKTERQKKAAREKVRAHRARLRAQGLRPIQFWVPDVRSPDFLAEAKRQCFLLNASAQDKEDMDFIEAISIRNED